MQITANLYSDLKALIRKAMTERGQSFQEATNMALQDALAGSNHTKPHFAQRTFFFWKPAEFSR